MIQVFVIQPFWIFCLLSLTSASFCQRANPNDPSWRNAQSLHQLTELNDTYLQRLCQMSDIGRINSYLDNILVPRPVGSENHKKVAMYIKRTLEEIGYVVDIDRFSVQTIIGERTFRNIIAVLDPIVPRRLTLACHYDSKDFRPQFEFMGAVDSAFPCAVLMDVAYSLSPYISNRGATDVTLQLIFFDGEEAFRDWTATDSIYGSRHLAQIWQDQQYPPLNPYDTREINRIDYLVLLDLLGSEGFVPNYSGTNDRNIYGWFYYTEYRLRQLSSCMDLSRPVLFSGASTPGNVEDDHLPFYNRAVRCMHIIPTPFPRVWHLPTDNRAALDEGVMKNVATIVRTFTARYLYIRM